MLDLKILSVISISHGNLCQNHLSISVLKSHILTCLCHFLKRKNKNKKWAKSCHFRNTSEMMNIANGFYKLPVCYGYLYSLSLSNDKQLQYVSFGGIFRAMITVYNRNCKCTKHVQRNGRSLSCPLFQTYEADNFSNCHRSCLLVNTGYPVCSPQILLLIRKLKHLSIIKH